MFKQAAQPDRARQAKPQPDVADGAQQRCSTAGAAWMRALDALPLQAKLTVNQPGDAYEQEADQVAEQVMRMPEPSVQRACACGGIADESGECPACRAKRLGVQRKSDSVAGTHAPASVHETIRAPGQPLDGSTRGFMESRFGHDFSGVRVHTNAKAAESATAVSAHAYTVGQNVVFADGRYAPGADDGKHLLAHELAHTVQQNTNKEQIQRQPAPGGAPRAGAAEQERRELSASQSALHTISEALSTGLFDWDVTEADARSVLNTLRQLRPQVLLHTILVMRMSGKWRTFVTNLSEADRLALSELEMQIDRDIGYITSGDDIRLEISLGSEIDRSLSLEYNVRSDGVNLMLIRQPVQINELLPRDAANAIARAYMDGLILLEPHVRLMVTKRGAYYAPEIGPTHQTFWFDSTVVPPSSSPEVQRRRKQSQLIDYLRPIRLGQDEMTDRAVSHYHSWIERNYTSPEFLTRSPVDLWQWALSQASQPAPASPLRPFLDILTSANTQLQAARPEERSRLQQTIGRYVAWIDQHRNDPNLSQQDAAAVYSRVYLQTLNLEIANLRVDATRRQQAQESEQQEQQRHTKFQEFFDTAMQLWGYTSRNFPYRIPIDVEGRDILVTGDPARQRVLTALANDMMNWATQHMYDANYLRTTPSSVLVDLLRGNYSERLEQAAHSPLQSESIDRHEIIPERALAAFGETVAKGLLVIAVVGLAVGAGVLTGGAALVLMGGIAAYAGVSSYMQRREEIERRHYDVAVPESMVHAAGDIVGLSQLIEGITGERLGTNERLTSIERSDEAGSGAGNVALLLVGSKAYRAGQIRGQRIRMTSRGTTPHGPEGATELPTGPVRPVPEPSPTPGPIERDLRTNLRDPRGEFTVEQLRMAFDEYVAGLRARGENVETVLGRPPAARRLQAIMGELSERAERITREFREEWARRRSADDPLRPLFTNVRQDGNVTVRFSRRPPQAHEIQQAQAIATHTGEPVEVFGDTALGQDYPGIDGVIGRGVQRPLSLKTAEVTTARLRAQQAMQAARTHGYSRVEVHIQVENGTIADVLGAWESTPPHMNEALVNLFGDETIGRIVIQASDGFHIIDPPVRGPALPGVGLPRDREGTRPVQP